MLSKQIKNGFIQMNDKIDQIANEIKLNQAMQDYDDVNYLIFLLKNHHVFQKVHIKYKGKLDQLRLLFDTAKQDINGSDFQGAIDLFLDTFDPHDEFAELNVRM